MKSVAIFVEGDSEKIFVFNTLLNIFNPSKITIECIKIRTGNNFQPDTHKYTSPNPEYYFQIINAGNDMNVVSSIYKRAKHYIQKLGYSSVIGLRDLYCHEYDKLSPATIDSITSNKIMSSAQDTITAVGLGTDVNLFFSVMEIEAWYFGFHEALERLGYPVERINQILAIDLQSIDPELEFYKPKKDIEKVHTSIKTTPFREVNFAEAMSKEILDSEIEAMLSDKRLSHFKLFINHLLTL